MARISIVIPAFNAEVDLANAVESLLVQADDTFELEIIIVNDGSTDNTLNIAQSYADTHPQMVKIVSQENQGVSVARNTAIDHSQGDYVGFLDADDFMLPNSLKSRLRCFELCPDVGFLFTNYYEEHYHGFAKPFIDGAKITLIEKASIPSTENCRILARPAVELMKIDPALFWTGAVMARKSVLDAAGRFKSGVELNRPPLCRGPIGLWHWLGEDNDMWRRLSAITRVAYLDELTVVYSQCRGGLEKYEKHNTLKIRELTTQLDNGNCSTEERRRIKRQIGHCYFGIAYKTFLPLLDLKSARKLLLKAVRFSPADLGNWKFLALSILPKFLFVSFLRWTCRRIRSEGKLRKVS